MPILQPPNIPSSGSALPPDGDYGDITVSSNGTVMNIDNDVVTYAKIQNVTDASLLGRSAGSSGDVQEITVGSGLSLSAGALTATGGSSSFDPSTTYEWYTDLEASSTNTADVFVSGTTLPSFTEAGHPGVWKLLNNTSNNATATLGRGDSSTADWLLGDGENIFEAVIKMPSILGNASSNEYTLWVGFGASITAPQTSTDYCAIAYNYTVNSGNWQARCRKASGTEQVSNHNASTAINTWVKLRVWVNAAGTQAKFYVNGVEINGGAINSAIPNTVKTWPIVLIRSGASSTTAKDLYVDYMWIKRTLTTPR